MARPLLLLLLGLLVGRWAAAAPGAGTLPADSTRDWPETWRRAPTDTARIKALLDLPVWYEPRDSVRAQQYARYALRLARRIGARRQEAGAWQGLGMSYLTGHRNAAARQCFRRALALAVALHDVRRMARYHECLGRAWAEEFRYAPARWEYWQQLRLARQAGNRKSMAEVYAEIGKAYERDASPKALRYLLKSLKIAEQENHATLLPPLLQLLGLFYQGQKDMPRAVGYFRRALLLHQQQGDPGEIGTAEVGLGVAYGQNGQDSLAAQHLRTGMRALRQIDPSQQLPEIALGLFGLAELAAKHQRAALAIPYYRRAAALFEQNHLDNECVHTLDRLALFYMGQGRARSALQTAEEALRHAGSRAGSRAETYSALAQASAATYDYPAAYRYQKRYQGLNDSLFNQAKSAQLATLSTRYQSQQKEAQIILLQRNTVLQARARTVLVGSLAVVALMGAATYRRYRRERRYRRQLQAKELELAARNHALERAEQQLRQSLDEKEVLLKEVHHRVKNNLQVIASRLALQALEQRAHPAVTAALRDGQNWVKSISLIHEMLYQSNDLASVEFQPFLEQLVAQLGRAFAGGGAGAVTCAVHAPNVRLGPGTAVPLGLVVNELLSNAYKHAFAGGRSGHVGIRLTAEATGGYCLRVRDDGAGLPPGFSLDTTASLGLRLVRSLARQLEGAIGVARPATGTEFCLTFREIDEPLPAAA